MFRDILCVVFLLVTLYWLETSTEQDPTTVYCRRCPPYEGPV
jgi:hypothetical protein